MHPKAMTLSRHILQEGQRHPAIAGELSELLVQIGFAAKILSREIGRAALVGKLGLTGEQNPTGDAQKKLDIFANETVIDAFAQTELVAGLVSEELDDVKPLACSNEAKYILCTDPLDGSSNTDINGAVGTIFGFYRRRTTGQCLVAEELRRKGAEQVAAGYVMYGTSTVLVYTCGHGVHGFTLDRDLGEFLLSHEQIRCPVRGHTYSANLGRSPDWHPHIRRFIEYLTIPDPATHRPYSLRYTGALVADLHRILLEGGLYLYPADAQHSDGKLRLLYECAPLALVVEQAGGRASTGTQRMLDLQATSLHQRAPLVIGSAEDVALYERLLTGGSPS